MKTKSYKTMDRAGWGSGPWDNEPDKMQWQDKKTGLPCLAVRNRMGNWCGYVGVTSDHRYYGKGYDDLDISVHGGLTFANNCRPHQDEARGICHLPEPGEPDNVWWLGFDCGHCGDYSPGMAARLREMVNNPFLDEKYRTLRYVRRQCRLLAAQLISPKS